MMRTWGVNSARLRATFAAPPGKDSSRTISTTGTGASGEMRETFPQRNSSSIRSPTTRMRLSEKEARISEIRSRFIKGESRGESLFEFLRDGGEEQGDH